MGIFSDKRWDNDDYLEINQYEDKEKEYDKYEELNEFQLNCGHCRRHLCTILKVVDIDFKNVFQAMCPCGDKSFIRRASGKFVIGPAEGMVLTNIDYGDTTKIIVEEK